MDNFLQKLYDAEMSKQAAANLGGFMKTLDVSDLEAFLGLSKEAVAGPVLAPLPDSLPQHRMDATMKAIAANLHREHQGTPAKANAGDQNLSYQGVGLPTSGTTKKAADCAAEAGKVFAKTAGMGQKVRDTVKRTGELLTGSRKRDLKEKLREADRAYRHHRAGVPPEWGGMDHIGDNLRRARNYASKTLTSEQRKVLLARGWAGAGAGAAAGAVAGTVKAVRGKKKEADMDVEQAGSAFNQKMAASKSNMVTPADHVAQNIGILRALTDTPQGPGGTINPELLARAKKNVLIGGLVGGGAGALIGAGGSYAGGLRGLQTVPGALLGLLQGGITGSAVGDVSTTRKWAKERGVHLNLLGSARFTPEAAARYLDPVVATKTASEEARAALVARAVSATKGAPEHIKEAAAKVVADEMSKIGFLPMIAGGAIGAAKAPKGESGKGAVRGGLAGFGANLGVSAGLIPPLVLVNHYADSGARISGKQKALLAGLGALGVIGGGVAGGFAGHRLGKKLAPYKHEMETA